MESSKIRNFDPKASELCQNFKNISNVGYFYVESCFRVYQMGLISDKQKCC